MKPFPEIVTFRVTSRCNNDCEHCFGPRKDTREMDIKKLKELFQLFHERKVKAILFTGGEPLVREDFGEIVTDLKNRGFKIFLDTNGDLFFNYSDLISDNVDIVGLPIDFPNKSYRNPDNLANVIKVLDFLKKRPKRPSIKIGTTVTRKNIGDLEKIGELIKNYPIDIWKIFEFIPQNVNAVKNKTVLQVPPEQFEEATKRVEEKFSNRLNLLVSRRMDRTKAYFFVASDGTVFMPVDDMNICKEVVVGNVFDDDIVDKWEKTVSEKNYVNNARVTFDYKFADG